MWETLVTFIPKDFQMRTRTNTRCVLVAEKLEDRTVFDAALGVIGGGTGILAAETPSDGGVFLVNTISRNEIHYLHASIKDKFGGVVREVEIPANELSEIRFSAVQTTIGLTS